MLWKVFLNINILHKITLTRSKIEKYFFRIKYFEHFLKIICNIFHMTTLIYKCEQKVSIIKKITKLYLILHTKLHIEISFYEVKLANFIILKY